MFRPACLPHPMSLFDPFLPLTPAEEKLISDCVGEARVQFGDGEVPSEKGPEVGLRAEVLRALLLSPDTPLNAKGLRVRGAYIQGVLDLQGATCGFDITLSRCRLDGTLQLTNARMRGLHVSGSQMCSLMADNAAFDGAVFLRDGTEVRGEISLAGARLDGDLQMCDLTVFTTVQDAIFAPSLRIDGSLFLGNYPYTNGTSSLKVDGGIFLSSLNVSHDVFVTNAAIAPRDDVAASGFFHATEEHGANIALSLARARVGGILFMRDNQIARGIVNLAGAQVARLRDEPAGPGATYPVRLDGFSYRDFSRHAEIGLRERLDWLERRPADTPFTAQPYEQLARVLSDMGLRRDASIVLMQKERLQRAANRQKMKSGVRKTAAWVQDHVLRLSVGYGYRSSRVLLGALVLISALGWFFDRTWQAGDMTPNAAPILISVDWIAATVDHPENPGAFWSQPGQAGQDWETFNGWAYAADVVIPIVNLGQESAWAPSTSRSDWGRAGWWIRWFAKAAGWIITALGAAAVTGAVRQE